MRYEIILAPQAIADLKRLSARDRSTIQDAINQHLRYAPDKVSQSRIKRLRGLNRPQYRLRVDEYRIFYDIVGSEIQILTILSKQDVDEWLTEHGE